MLNFNFKHTRGANCKVCCCSGPDKCKEKDCSGFVHQNVVDEAEYADGDWDWVHNYKCDTCEFKKYYMDDLEVEFDNAD